MESNEDWRTQSANHLAMKWMCFSESEYCACTECSFFCSCGCNGPGGECRIGIRTAVFDYLKTHEMESQFEETDGSPDLSD